MIGAKALVMIASGRLKRTPSPRPSTQPATPRCTSGMSRPIAKRFRNAPRRAARLSGNSSGNIIPTEIAPNTTPASKPYATEVMMVLARGGLDSDRLETVILAPHENHAATGFADIHAAAVKQMVMAIEKATGMTNRYFQLTTVMAANESANAQAVPRISASVAAGRRPSCQANIAAKR